MDGILACPRALGKCGVRGLGSEVHRRGHIAGFGHQVNRVAVRVGEGVSVSEFVGNTRIAVCMRESVSGTGRRIASVFLRHDFVLRS
jgi:hypothetical protein